MEEAPPPSSLNARLAQYDVHDTVVSLGEIGESNSSLSSVKPLSRGRAKGEGGGDEKRLKKLEEEIRVARVRSKKEKEELVSQLLQLRSKYDRVLEKVRDVENSAVKERELERYLRKMEERQMKMSREMSKMQKKIARPSPPKISSGGLVRAFLVALVGLCVVFLPELPPGPFPPTLDVIISRLPPNWEACLERFGVFSMTIIMLHLVIESPSPAHEKQSLLRTLITEGVLVWGISIVVKSLIGLAEALATMIAVTVCGLLLRGDLEAARIKFPIVEDSGGGGGEDIEEGAGGLRTFGGEGKGITSEGWSKGRSVSPRTKAWLESPPRLTANGTHIFDHRDALRDVEGVGGVKSSVKSQRRLSTPSPMSAKHKKELEVLNNVVPVTNKDTGEAVDLKFLEELSDMCNVFDGIVEGGLNGGRGASNSSPPKLSPKMFSTPSPKGSRRFSSERPSSFSVGGTGGRIKRQSLMKRLKEGGLQGGNKVKEKMMKVVGK